MVPGPYDKPRPPRGRGVELPPIRRHDPTPVSVRVVYACPHCDRPLRLRPEYFGAALACKHCDRPFVPSLARAVSNLPDRAACAGGGDHPATRRQRRATV